MVSLLVENHPAEYIKEELATLQLSNDGHYRAMDKEVYASVSTAASDGTLISTQLNVNREVHHAFKSMLRSLEALLTLVEQEPRSIK